ncbi:hypothetical protein JCM10450v2_002856 [Rhodotorula kratochvilovae]
MQSTTFFDADPPLHKVDEALFALVALPVVELTQHGARNPLTDLPDFVNAAKKHPVVLFDSDGGTRPTLRILRQDDESAQAFLHDEKVKNLIYSMSSSAHLSLSLTSADSWPPSLSLAVARPHGRLWVDVKLDPHALQFSPGPWLARLPAHAQQWASLQAWFPRLSLSSGANAHAASIASGARHQVLGQTVDENRAITNNLPSAPATSLAPHSRSPKLQHTISLAHPPPSQPVGSPLRAPSPAASALDVSSDEDMFEEAGVTARMSARGANRAVEALLSSTPAATRDAPAAHASAKTGGDGAAPEPQTSLGKKSVETAECGRAVLCTGSGVASTASQKPGADAAGRDIADAARAAASARAVALPEETVSGAAHRLAALATSSGAVDAALCDFGGGGGTGMLGERQREYGSAPGDEHESLGGDRAALGALSEPAKSTIDTPRGTRSDVLSREGGGGQRGEQQRRAESQHKALERVEKADFAQPRAARSEAVQSSSTGVSPVMKDAVTAVLGSDGQESPSALVDLRAQLEEVLPAASTQSMDSAAPLQHSAFSPPSWSHSEALAPSPHRVTMLSTAAPPPPSSPPPRPPSLAAPPPHPPHRGYPVHPDRLAAYGAFTPRSIPASRARSASPDSPSTSKRSCRDSPTRASPPENEQANGPPRAPFSPDQLRGPPCKVPVIVEEKRRDWDDHLVPDEPEYTVWRARRAYGDGKMLDQGPDRAMTVEGAQTLAGHVLQERSALLERIHVRPAWRTGGWDLDFVLNTPHWAWRDDKRWWAERMLVWGVYPDDTLGRDARREKHVERGVRAAYRGVVAGGARQ